MSIQAVSWALQHSAAKLGARLVLIAIANHADAQGRNSFPSVLQIASEAHLSERQVQRALRTLERQGEIRIAEGKGRHGTHLYELPRMGDNMTPIEGDNMSGGVTNRTARGDKSGQKHTQNVTRTVLNRPNNHSAPNGAAGEAPAADPVRELFDRGLAALGGPTSAHRSLLGKLRKQHGDAAVLAAIVACEAELPSEPVAFLIGCLARAGPAAGNGKHPGTYRPGPGAALFEGAYRAVERFADKLEQDQRVGEPLALPLLARK